ncbi:xaa-Arg dipeptidase-like [Dysidea avara]|uniref:xaa-Arg dipeptidase-like n=1 Tax=Dysidea avara TaxID=196820 RepID=UPI0033286D8D
MEELHSNLKARAIAEIETYSEELRKVSEEIWNNPELDFKEHKAHALLTNFLEGKGFHVERSYLGIQTAFRATFGDSTGPNVCVICEYDALPEIGHACGHNLIAEAGIAAALGIKAVLKTHGAPKGLLTIMGTPAEEGGGGKINLIEKGAFESIDVAMMVHPCPSNHAMPTALAIMTLEIIFHGKAAHAAAFPWEGVNALDAAVITYNSISMLRQQMKPTWRVHGIITNGGAKPNIIPELTKMEYYLRAPTRSEVKDLYSKVMACYEAAAKATGCTVEVSETAPFYEDLASNLTLSNLYETNAKHLGIVFAKKDVPFGSTDMGNVSYVVPSIHPMYKIGDGSQVNHTREFTAITNTSEAHQHTLIAAKAMSMTVVDVLTNPAVLEQIKKEFASDISLL